MLHKPIIVPPPKTVARNTQQTKHDKMIPPLLSETPSPVIPKPVQYNPTPKPLEVPKKLSLHDPYVHPEHPKINILSTKIPPLQPGWNSQNYNLPMKQMLAPHVSQNYRLPVKQVSAPSQSQNYMLPVKRKPEPSQSQNYM